MASGERGSDSSDQRARAEVEAALEPPARLDGSWVSWFALDDVLYAAKQAGLDGATVNARAPWIASYIEWLIARGWRETGRAVTANRTRLDELDYEIVGRDVVTKVLALGDELPLGGGLSVPWCDPAYGPAALASWAPIALWAAHPWSRPALEAEPAADDVRLAGVDSAELVRRTRAGLAHTLPWIARENARAVAADTPQLAPFAITLATAMFRPPLGHPLDPHGHASIARTARVAAAPETREAAAFLLRRWLVGADRVASATALEVLLAMGLGPVSEREADAFSRRLLPRRREYLPEALANLVPARSQPGPSRLSLWWRSAPAPRTRSADPLEGIEPNDKTALARLRMRLDNDIQRRSERVAQIGAEGRVLEDRVELAKDAGRARAARELGEQLDAIGRERASLLAEVEELRRHLATCNQRLEALGLVPRGVDPADEALAVAIGMAAAGVDLVIELPPARDAAAGGGAWAAFERAFGPPPPRAFGDAVGPPPVAPRPRARHAPLDAALPERFGAYEVKALLGEGGMGRVFRVHHAEWDLELALKVPRGRIDDAARLGLVREADAWASLGLHPHVTTCYFAESHGGEVWILSELVVGGSLDKWIARAPLSDDRAGLAKLLAIAWETAVGLHHAHDRGLVHQDVKPSNVLVSRAGVAKVTDFGLARGAVGTSERGGGGSKTIVAGFVGMTPAYCSPEQASAASRRGGADSVRITRRTDVWSWAAMILECFTGKMTWRLGPQVGQALADFRRAGLKAEGRPTMPDALAELLRRCLEASPDDRPRTMREIADAIAEIDRVTTGAAPRQIAAAASDRADELFNRGYGLASLGMFARGAALWRDALSVDPLHVESAFALAVTRWRAGEIGADEALRRFEDVHQFVSLRAESGGMQDGERAKARIALAWIHAERGELDAAKRVLDALGEAPPPHQREAATLAGIIERRRAGAPREGDPPANKPIARGIGPVEPMSTEHLVVKQAELTAGVTEVRGALSSGRFERANELLCKLRSERTASRHPKTRALWSDLAERSSRGAPSAVWPVAEIDDPRGALRAIELLPSGEEVLAVADDDRDVVVFDALSSRERARLRHDEPVAAIAVALRGELVVTASGHEVHVRRGLTPERLARARLDHAPARVTVSYDGRFVLAHDAERWTLLELAGGALDVRAQHRADRALRRAALAQGSESAIFATERGTILVDFARPAEPIELDAGAAVDVVRPAATGAAVIARADGQLFDARTGKVSELASASPLAGVAASYDGALALTVDDAGVARVWSLPDVRSVARLSGHSAPATDVAMTPDGRCAATAGRDGRIRLWSIEWELASLAPLSVLPQRARELLARARASGVARHDLRRELAWAGYGAATDEAIAAG